MATCQTITLGYDSYLGQYTGSGNILRMGVQVSTGNSFIGNTFTELQFALQKKNSPTGNIKCVIYESDNSTLSATSNNVIDSSTLAATETNYTFTFSSTQTIQDGFYYQITADGTNNFDHTNGVKPSVENDVGSTITGNKASQFTTTDTAIIKNASETWCVGGASPSSGGTRLPPPPLIARF